jgi:SanA protein
MVNKNITNWLFKNKLKLIKLGYFVFVGLLLITINYFYINFQVRNLHSSQIKHVPNNQVGLLLGTSAKLKSGGANQYFTNRINAAVKLYTSSKIKFILVSGDNSDKTYNEPEKMKQALIDRGIPENRIFLDYAGFNTLDSVIRSQKVFGQNQITIISQKFHNQRALYIAKKIGLEAYGFDAANPNIPTPRVYLREVLARVKMFFEIHLLNKDPKFLGEPIQIN